jgi:hypothetical protein
MDPAEKSDLVAAIPSLCLCEDLYAPGFRAEIRAAQSELFRIVRQPKRGVYRLMIDEAARACEYAVLVVEGKLKRRGAELLRRLDPYIESVMQSSEWPGTRLLYGTRGLVYTLVLHRKCREILKRAVEGLFDWKPPHLPEDLCFLRADGSPWLVSSTCTASAFICLREDEKDALLSRVQTLRLERVHQQGP